MKALDKHSKVCKLRKQREEQKRIDNENKGWFCKTPNPIFIPKKQFKKK